MCSVIPRIFNKAGRFLNHRSYIDTRNVLESFHITSSRTYSRFQKTNENSPEHNVEEREETVAPGVKSNFNILREDDAVVILDVQEEMDRLHLETINDKENVNNPYEGINLKRGTNGVFDIDEFVDLLRKDKAQKIFVTAVPKELSYVNYLVIATGMSSRHISALATFIRKAYKLKRNDNDIIPMIEGARSKDWVALDLGNIALHLFTQSARELYDLETLWAVGAAYDQKLNQTDVEEEFEDRYMKYLGDLQPAGETESSDSMSNIVQHGKNYQ